MSSILENVRYAVPMGTNDTPFGAWLREQLAKRGWGASDLAHEIGVRPSTISRYLTGTRGRPDPDMCKFIATGLGLPASAVLTAAGYLDEDGTNSLILYDLQRSIFGVTEGLTDVQSQLRREFIGRRVLVDKRPALPASEQCWHESVKRRERVEVSLEWLGDRSPESVFMVIAMGDHLRSRLIADGQRVLCERLPDNGEPDNHQIAVIRYQGRYVLRVWFRDGDWVELRDGDGNVLERFSIAEPFKSIGTAFYVLGHELR